MKLKIQTLTTLLLMAVILLTGCSRNKTDKPQRIASVVDTQRDAAEKTGNNSEHPDKSPDIVENSTPILVPEISNGYKGDPFLYISGIEYDDLMTVGREIEFTMPILPPHIQETVNALSYWKSDGQKRTEDEYKRLYYSILSEGFTTDLEMAQYLLLSEGRSDGTRKYAQKALDAKPDDYQTLYVWTKSQVESSKLLDGYYQLLERNSKSADLMRNVGFYMLHDEIGRYSIKQAISFLEKAAALSTNNRDSELAYDHIGDAYLKLKDGNGALAAYKRAQTFNYSDSRQRNLIETIERGELP